MKGAALGNMCHTVLGIRAHNPRRLVWGFSMENSEFGFYGLMEVEKDGEGDSG